MNRITPFFLIFLFFVVSCNNSDEMHNTNNFTNSSEKKDKTALFSLSSLDFSNGNTIPTDCACEWLGGKNRPPSLLWENTPPETESFALIMDDETFKSGDGATKHWSVFNIPA